MDNKDYSKQTKYNLLLLTSLPIKNERKTPVVIGIRSTSVDKNNGTNDKFYRKVAIIMYTKMSNFRLQS